MAKQPVLAKTKKKEEEPNFKWEGTDKRGVRVKGELRGANQNLIKAELRRQGIQPLRVSKKAKPLFTFGDKIVPKDIMLFTWQVCTMLSSGIAVVQALDMVGNSNRKPKVKELILSIKTDVESGTSRPRLWPSIICISMTCIAAWCMLAKKRVYWKCCSTRSRPIWKNPRRSRSRSRRR